MLVLYYFLNLRVFHKASKEVNMRKSIFRTLVFSAVLYLMLSSVVLAGTTTFYAQDKVERNVMRFESHAPLETIVGVTNQITGDIKVDPMNIKDRTSAKFEVDLASMKTGIGLRDSHMRDKYLETDKFPKVIFTLDKVISASKDALADQETVALVAEGTFELHGVKRKQQMDLKVTYFKESETTRLKLPGDLMRVEGTFIIKLSDYNIKVPTMVILKLDENIKVDIDVFANTVAPCGEHMDPCDPCSKKMDPCDPCSKKIDPCNPCGE